ALVLPRKLFVEPFADLEAQRLELRCRRERDVHNSPVSAPGRGAVLLRPGEQLTATQGTCVADVRLPLLTLPGGVHHLLMPTDPKRVVRDGYDEVAARYAAWTCHGDGVKAKYVAIARSLVAPGERVLDLGCGTGDHVTSELAQQFDVVGVDLSAVSVGI